MASIINKQQLDEMRQKGQTDFQIAKEEEIKRVKYLFLNKMYNADRDIEMINASIKWALETNKLYTEPVYLSLPYDLRQKEFTLFEQEAVCEILMDLGYNKLMPLKSFNIDGHNKQYFVHLEQTPQLIVPKLTDITIHNKKHHWFFWKPEELRIYFSIYIG
jgi:hypothetical protein